MSRPILPDSNVRGVGRRNHATPCTPELTPIKEPQLNPLSPKGASLTTYQPLTPPPSGHSKPLLAPDGVITSFRPATPPTSPDIPETPVASATPAGTTSFSSPRTTSHLASWQTTCSNCHRCSTATPHSSPPSPCSQAQTPLIISNCGHRLCLICLRASLLRSLYTDPFVPATCPSCPSCPRSPFAGTSNNTSTPQPGLLIPLATLGQVATATEFLAYRFKLRETRTPENERLYCHNKEKCPGMFLSGEMLRARVGVCPLCGGRTCRRCGGRGHMFGVRRETGRGYFGGEAGKYIIRCVDIRRRLFRG
ncbi:hypothetical protein VTI74DRAFT_4417 [Chaetomium olivicolor]